MNWIWIFIIILSLYLAVRSTANTRKAGGLPRHFNDLIKKVQTDKNKDRIESAIKFHNSRVAAGADGGDSFGRLVNDIKRIGGVDEDKPKDEREPKEETPPITVTPAKATTEEELNEIEGLCGHIPMVWPLNDLDAEHYLCTRRLTELTAKLVKEIRQDKGA